MKYCLLLVFCLVYVGAGCGSPVATVSSQPTSAPLVQDSVIVASSTAASTTALGTAPSSTTAVASTSTQPVVPPKDPAPKPTPPRPGTKPTPPADPNKPKPSTYYVSITEDAFSPKVLVIRAGDTVVWVNRSYTNHTVVASEAALLWDSGNLAPNKSYKRTFPYPGTYNYNCSVHAGMKATVVVR